MLTAHTRQHLQTLCQEQKPTKKQQLKNRKLNYQFIFFPNINKGRLSKCYTWVADLFCDYIKYKGQVIIKRLLPTESRVTRVAVRVGKLTVEHVSALNQLFFSSLLMQKTLLHKSKNREQVGKQKSSHLWSGKHIAYCNF